MATLPAYSAPAAASGASPNAANAPSFPRELHFHTPHFSKDIEITAPQEPDPAQHVMHVEISNWSRYDAVIHQGPTQSGPPIAGAKFHRRSAELGLGDPADPNARWFELHNENSWGRPRFLLTIPSGEKSSQRTFRWEKTRDGDDGVQGKHYRMRDTKTGHVAALYVVGSSSRKGSLIYKDSMTRDQALLVLISFISVIVKGRRSQAGAAGAAGAAAGAAAAGGGGGA